MPQQQVFLPYLRGSPIHIPRRDLVVASSDSLTLLVTVVESDDPTAKRIDLTGGLGGPVARLCVWSLRGHGYAWWDYGAAWCDSSRLIGSADGTISATEPGSWDFFIPAGNIGGPNWMPPRCGWSFHLVFDDQQQSEMLAHGIMQIRWGARSMVPLVPLLTDDGTPVLTDT